MNMLIYILFYINPKMAVIRSSFNFINAKVDVMDAKNAKVLTGVKGDIKYENVKFSYDGVTTIFENLNLHIHSGERVGIVNEGVGMLCSTPGGRVTE
jgi:ATP-binding cassette subfamily B protein